jgi:hypothetical protein
MSEINDDETQCCECENWYYPDDMFNRDGELYCDWCYNREETCCGCEKIFPTIEMFNPTLDKYFCEDCYGDMCFTCKKFVLHKNMVLSCGDWKCEDCDKKSKQPKKRLVMTCVCCEKKKDVKQFSENKICVDCHNAKYKVYRTYFDFEFYTEYLMEHSHKAVKGILKKQYSECDDEPCESYVIYLKNEDACYNTCLFLLQAEDGVLPIYVRNINTSSCMAMSMSGMFDDDDCETLMSLDEIIEMTSKGFRASVKKIIESER